MRFFFDLFSLSLSSTSSSHCSTKGHEFLSNDVVAENRGRNKKKFVDQVAAAIGGIGGRGERLAPVQNAADVAGKIRRRFPSTENRCVCICMCMLYIRAHIRSTINSRDVE